MWQKPWCHNCSQHQFPSITLPLFPLPHSQYVILTWFLGSSLSHTCPSQYPTHYLIISPILDHLQLLYILLNHWLKAHSNGVMLCQLINKAWTPSTYASFDSKSLFLFLFLTFWFLLFFNTQCIIDHVHSWWWYGSSASTMSRKLLSLTCTSLVIFVLTIISCITGWKICHQTTV